MFSFCILSITRFLLFGFEFDRLSPNFFEGELLVLTLFLDRSSHLLLRCFVFSGARSSFTTRCRAICDRRTSLSPPTPARDPLTMFFCGNNKASLLVCCCTFSKSLLLLESLSLTSEKTYLYQTTPSRKAPPPLLESLVTRRCISFTCSFT